MATPTALPSSFTAGDVLTAANMNLLRGAFRILQVVSATHSTEVSSSSSTYADTGLTASITPTATSNKVLVMLAHNGNFKDTSDTRILMRLFRGATNIAQLETFGGYTNNTNANGCGTIGTIYLDNPATTSSTTYKTQIASSGNNARVLTQAGSAVSSIVLCEVSL